MERGEERTEELGGGLRAYVSAQHTFGVDAVLLAHFASPKKGERLCDLGTGCGIIPLLWSRGGTFSIDAFEIQPQAAALARRAKEENGLAGLRVFCADLRALPREFYAGYDLVACNPPYGGGKASESDARRIARHEACCTLTDAAQAAAKLLRGAGRFCLCHRPERLCDVLAALRGAGIEPKRMRLVQASAAKKPFLVLVEGRRQAKPGLTVEPALITACDGAATREMREIYGFGPAEAALAGK